MVCIIAMPPKELSPWWRGKRGFQVGSFPSECVELISGKVPESLVNSLPKPAPKKRGKLPPFLRSVVKARPRRAEQPEPEKEGVFGCDLGEHLLHSGRDVPQVLQSCSEFIEQHGVVRGIYRLSGVTSKIQRLRHEFDSEQVPELSVRDIHSVSSVCKMYFRELPNPLVTEQLYDKFSDAARAATEEERLLRMKDAIQQLPAPHYRTLEYLMRHLASLAGSSSVTNMDAKNLAIVWAPNLLRSQQSQSACVSGGAACLEVQTQAAVVEFLIGNTDVLFHTKSTSAVGEGAGHSSVPGPESVRESPPATKLLTLQEAQALRRGQSSSPAVAQSSDIEVEEDPAAISGRFHTVLDFPSQRPPSVGKRQLQRSAKEPSQAELVVLAGESSPCEARRAGSSADGSESASINGQLMGSPSRCTSNISLACDSSDGEKEGLT
ncbi:rho GTPase-activating protein 32-like [Excalfactoria chinensis]|uniref:rho GTPase-activating protein 32-like n=1 Tax=Excalfactoria chinensis TaxID=46218 RepID=UPI003B3BDA73